MESIHLVGYFYITFIISICFIFVPPRQKRPDFEQIYFHLVFKNGSIEDVTKPGSYSGCCSGNNTEIIVLVPGWIEFSSKKWVVEMTDAYLSRKEKEYLVILVEWSYDAFAPYFELAGYIHLIGRFIADWVIVFSEIEKFDLDTVHVVGHSLGSHVTAFIGRRIIEARGRPLLRITSLDASGPAFFNSCPEKRLYKGDAQLVVAVHTDDGFLGYDKPYGDVDFYPNGGQHGQPGCVKCFFDRFFEMCSHYRSHDFWEEALRKYSFYGTECDSWENYKKGLCDGNKKLNFGGDITSITLADSGFYFAVTNSDEPWILDPPLTPYHPSVQGRHRGRKRENIFRRSDTNAPNFRN